MTLLPQLNPHLYNDPKMKALWEFEAKHGIASMGECAAPLHSSSGLPSFSLICFSVFGVLTSLSGRAPQERTVHLREKLAELSKSSGLTESQVLLRWAWDRTQGVLVTSTSREERAKEALQVLSQSESFDEATLAAIEEAALKDGYEGQRVRSSCLCSDAITSDIY
jgi:diketogulonate reductase-like aldo/keto reductase